MRSFLRGSLLALFALLAPGCPSPRAPVDSGVRDVVTDAGPPEDGGRSGAEPRVTTCAGDAIQPTAGAVCTATAGGPAVLLTGDVLTPGEVLRGGQVLIDGAGTIACVACDCSREPAAQGATAVVCADGVISPGLINAHDHLTYAQNSPYGRTAERFEHRHDWRLGVLDHTLIRANGGANDDQMAYGELRFVMGGATSVNGSGGASGFLRNLDGFGMEGLGQQPVEYETFPLGDTDGTLRASGCDYPMVDTAASIAGLEAYAPHVAEGILTEARNEFLCIRAGATDLVQPQSAFIHGVGLLPADMAEMAADRTALIWSPRTNISLYGDTARVTEYARMGVMIALGSDWIISGSMNMLRELRCADGLDANYFGDFFTDEALWLMATRDAAAALAMDDAIGILLPGRAGDVAVFNAAMRRDHRAVIDAQAGDVALVLRGGEVMYGDAAVVAAMQGGGACDALDVCGVGKRVCVSREFGGRNLGALMSANSGRYALFFCGEPAGEPTCLPERNASAPNPVVNGSTRYAGVSSAGDLDGDGITNTQDNCPRVFNPVRPLDTGRQADGDGDGAGDACDPCPLVANATDCAAPNPNDPDADGVVNAVDNCPDAANPAQTDGDRDGRGDPCDPCPMDPNPGPAACPAGSLSIATLRNPAAMGHPMAGAQVTVRGGVVTAVKSSGTNHGFFLQDPSATEWGGVFVFVGGAAVTVARGDAVAVYGTYTVFNGLEQLDVRSGSVSVTGTAAVPAPIALADPLAIDTGAPQAVSLQSMLVRIGPVVARTATSGTEFTVGVSGADAGTAALRVTSFVASDTTNPPAIRATAGQTFASITGLVYASGGNSKLAPRDAADVVTP